MDGRVSDGKATDDIATDTVKSCTVIYGKGTIRDVIGNRHHTPDVVFEFPGLNKVPRTNTDCNVRTTSSQT